MNDLLNTLLQNALKVGGGFLVAKGIASDSQVTDIIGGIIAIVGVVIEYFHHKKLASTPAAPAATTTPTK